MRYYYNNELYHHGIKGQKWGVRNGPPYPLDAEHDSVDNNSVRNTLGLKNELDVEKCKKIALGIGVTLGTAAGVYAVGYVLAANPDLLMRMPDDLSKAGHFLKSKLKLIDEGYNDSGSFRTYKIRDSRLFANGDVVGGTCAENGYVELSSRTFDGASDLPSRFRDPDRLIRNVRLNQMGIFSNDGPRRLSCWSGSNAYFTSRMTGKDYVSKSFNNLVNFNDFGELYKTKPKIFNINGMRSRNFVGEYGRHLARCDGASAETLIESIFNNITGTENVATDGKTTIGFINAGYHATTCTHQFNFEIVNSKNDAGNILRNLFIADSYTGERYQVATKDLGLNKIFNTNLGRFTHELEHYNASSLRFYAPSMDQYNLDTLSKVILGRWK